MSRHPPFLRLLVATGLTAFCTMSTAPPHSAAGVLTASLAADFVLGSTPITVTLPAPAEQRLAVVMARGGPLYLAIEGPKMVHPGAIYQIYLDLPAGKAPDPAGPYFVGNLSLYTEPGGAVDSRLTYDITAQVKALHRRGEWHGPVQVTFVPEYPGEAHAGAIDAPPAYLRFTRVSIVER
jgi:hypothetical protein